MNISYECINCSSEYTILDLKDICSNEEGFWCEDCDHYNYLNKEDNPISLIVLEKKYHKELMRYPKSDIKLKKRLSPLRYPGGKTKMIDYLHSKMRKFDNHLLVSPFIGGGSFELSLLDSGVISELYMNDYDYGVYSFWNQVVSNPSELIARIQSYTPTREDFYRYREQVLNQYKDCYSELDAAYAFFITNRLAYSGIAFANILGGKSRTGDEYLSRWNPDASISKIKYIHENFKDKIKVFNLDFTELMQEHGAMKRGTIFIDPPYYLKGDDLYVNKMSKQMHEELAFEIQVNLSNYALSDILITYDYHEDILKLYDFVEQEVIGRKYSI